MKLHPPFNPLRIGIDLDGVLANFIPNYVSQLEWMSGRRAPDNYIWDNWHCEEKLGFNKEAVGKVWEVLMDSSGGEMFWRTLPRLCSDEDKYLIQELICSHDIYFITNRPLVHKATTENWVHKNILDWGVPPTVLLTEDKGPVAAALKLHCMIDDKVDNLVGVLRHCKTTCVPLLMDATWNKDCDHREIHRISTITGALDKLQEIMLQ